MVDHFDFNALSNFFAQIGIADSQTANRLFQKGWTLVAVIRRDDGIMSFVIGEPKRVAFEREQSEKKNASEVAKPRLPKKRKERSR